METAFQEPDWSVFEPDLILKKEKTGSRIISPETASDDSDYDWIILIDDWDLFVENADDHEWHWSGNERYLPEKSDFFGSAKEGHRGFASFVRDTQENTGYGKANLIVTISDEFYEDFVLATKIATELKLKTRSERVCLFQGILYGNFMPVKKERSIGD